jgi:hypothetical protein
LYSTYFLKSFAVCMYPCFASESTVLLYIVPLYTELSKEFLMSFSVCQQFLHQSHMHQYEMKLFVFDGSCVKHLL